MISDSLKELDATIQDIEAQIKSEPNPFLESILERLLIVKNNSFTNLYEKAKLEYEKPNKIQGGFKGYGVS